MAKARFDVSTEGMAGLHEGRELWSLVKELVANAWDEDTTICEVILSPIFGPKGEERIGIFVEDDGPGFKDINDAFTLMAPTHKREEAEVRGRFNIGEKEILSIAIEGKVETVGKTVHFPEEGGRTVTDTKRKKGTIVSAVVKRPHHEIETTVTALRGFLPPHHIDYRVNLEKVENREFLAETVGRLRTIIAGGLGKHLEYSYRKSRIDIYEPRGETGHIFEMGITIQPIEMPYDVDIQQKVPMPPNRDTVTVQYLQSIYAEVLKVVIDDLDESEASESWVQQGVEYKRTTDEVVKKVMEKKLGTDVVLWSKDTYANEVAHDAGMDVIQPKTLSKVERDRFKKVGLETSHGAYGLRVSPTLEFDFTVLDGVEITPAMKKVEEYTKWLSNQLLGFECEVRFLSEGFTNHVLAQYGNRSLDFIASNLGEQWFEMGDTPTEAQTEIILHELAHEGGSKLPHSGEYVDRIAQLGAKSTHLAMTAKWWNGSMSKPISQTVQGLSRELT
ncbi:MAG: hypothetical protein CL755_12485 [Chloroflexi bacterium]|nr:hypothetical protein [Chloroflexota bacterium]